MGCAGHPIVRTPNIDRLAAEGVRFSRTYTQSPLCVPARASLITGLYPHETGTVMNDTHSPEPDAPNFLHQLQAAGYTTAIIGKSHIGFTPQDTREREPRLKSFGFDYVDEESGKMAFRLRSPWTEILREKGLLEAYQRDVTERLARAASPLFGFTEKDLAGLDLKEAWYAAPSPAMGSDYIDNFIGDNLIRWLESYSDDRPFFLWAGFCGPHDPWDAPQEYAEPYLARLDEIPLDSTEPPERTPSESYNTFLRWMANFADSEHFTDERIRWMRAFYYGNITLVDQRIGDMLRVIEERGDLDNTWIIYASDHGEFAGHHRLLSKVIMYESSMRVPLIVRPPQGMPARTVDDLVELNDAAATVVDAAGAPPVEGSHAKSLLPYLSESAPRLREAAFSEVMMFSTVVTDRYKYVIERETGVPCALFDLENDPQEDHNLAADPAFEGLRNDLYRDYLQPFLAK